MWIFKYTDVFNGVIYFAIYFIKHINLIKLLISYKFNLYIFIWDK